MHPSPRRRRPPGRAFPHPLSRHRPTCPPWHRPRAGCRGRSGPSPRHEGAHRGLVKGQISELARGELGVLMQLWAQVYAPSSLSSGWDPESNTSLT